MSNRQTVTSGTVWESKIAYSRAIRLDRHIRVSGTTAADETGHVVGHGDAYTQAKYVLRKIKKALEELGASMDDVVRTRMYLTNIDDWAKVGEAHGEFFHTARPAATMIEVSRLIVPDCVVEIEAEAVLPPGAV
jgi:enamine deaminase RidA (YjgF/YER057c/UK114 family)